MSNKIIFVFFISFSFSHAFAQTPDLTLHNTRAEYEQNYKYRITQKYLAGVYIPIDLPDAFTELNRLTDSSSRKIFMQLNEYQAEHKLFFSLTRWICTNWGLYEGSRIGQYLREAGLSYPEDQATAIVICWHRSLNKDPIAFKILRDKLVEKRHSEFEALQKNKKTKEIIVPANNSPVAKKN
jgi:hypothetical protein